jgi:RNA polymerase sigma factor (sigma-70 family)
LDADQLFRRYYLIELAWLRSKVCNPADAEDILAAAFLKVCSYTKRHPGQRVAFPRTWLRTVVTNCLVDHYRYWGRRPQHAENDHDQRFDDWCDDWGLLVEDNFDHDLVHQAERIDQLAAIIDTAELCEADRAMLILRLNEYSFAEIADMLDLISESAARGRFYRLRRTIMSPPAGAESPQGADLYLTEANP